eukprot:CAMPEP_0174866046 /NCGR_PEP_ID=MMETSP1114-20130205/61429_1 /TAXON_ID=312471 /ORGANISM="Neobodo designis, Strain CCAP 1951/1" /LENGTH=134 /DNA_ID=CAMNT_0016101187 /DNA_START=30 /DNA_END=430 /DNA_ORIENTATION=+
MKVNAATQTYVDAQLAPAQPSTQEPRIADVIESVHLAFSNALSAIDKCFEVHGSSADVQLALRARAQTHRAIGTLKSDVLHHMSSIERCLPRAGASSSPAATDSSGRSPRTRTLGSIASTHAEDSKHVNHEVMA